MSDKRWAIYRENKLEGQEFWLGIPKVKEIAGTGHESEANREDWRRNSLLKIVKRWVHCQGIKDSVSTI